MREAAAPADLIELGAVRGAYGVRGWARIAPHAADGGVLEAVREWWIVRDGDRQCVTIEGCRRQGDAILAKWPGCESKEAADALKGAAVAVARGAFPPLPEGEHYLGDVLGSRVVNRAGEVLGEVTGLRASEAAGVRRQWLEVADGGRTHLIPLVEQYVDEVDATGRLVRVDWQRDW
ncbi:MAG: ribosome maturation factor RimM [Betaproteobacteria bacterium]